MIAAALTLDELSALAFVVEQHRDRVPAAEHWDRAGIVAHLRKLDLEPGDALTVALLAAADPTARMPIAITWPQYRTGLTSSSGQRRPHGPVCDHCGRSRLVCARIQRNQGLDLHEFRPAVSVHG